MQTNAEHEKDRWDPEPRWPALIAVIAVGGLYFALPGYLIIGPRWLFPAVVIALLIPTRPIMPIHAQRSWPAILSRKEQRRIWIRRAFEGIKRLPFITSLPPLAIPK